MLSSTAALMFSFLQGVSLRDSVLIPGLFVALASQLLTQAKSLNERRSDQSQFYLDACLKAYEEAEELLRNGNNARILWIAAERALKIAWSLSSNVSLQSHKEVLELHEMKYRRLFHGHIQKPSPFFYGISEEGLELEEAAKRSSQGDEKDDITTVSSIRHISESSLLAVWRAAQWPKEAEEKAMTSDEYFPQSAIWKLGVLYPGLSRFIDHSRRFHSAAGELFERKATDYTTGTLPWDRR